MHVLLMYTPDPPSAAHVARLRALDPQLRVTVASSEAEARAAGGTAEIILGQRYLRQVLPEAPHLRWVQSTSGGTDHLPESVLAKRGIVLTRFTGASKLVARHALALAWALTRGLPTLAQQHEAATWAKALPLLPSPARALILGTGPIGRALSPPLRAHGLHVTGVKRRLDGALPDFDALLDRSNWRTALPSADWCFLALPHTPDTVNMVDEDALRALPPHAVVVNVGRGETLDLSALIRVLEEGRLGGAALDVVPHALDPLPPDHPLWTTPRLLISPHVAGHDPTRGPMVEAFVEAQVARYLAGEPLHNVVTRAPRASAV
ncbi:MAG: D-2-hydroxyacid dehydrogenase [Salinivenus sp.]